MNIFHLDFWLHEISPGNVFFSPLSIISGLFLLLLAIVVQRWIQSLLRRRVFPRIGMDPGLAYAYYQSDVHHVREALEEAGRASPNLLSDPSPSARFLEFGDSSLNFELRVWTIKMSDREKAFRSEINFLIWEHFKRHNIEVPYPQRDLYIKEMPTGVHRETE